MQRGHFISFEGGEGAGKSTQIRRLAERLEGQGLKVELTREPGGSVGAESLRDLLVRGDADRWSAVSETLILFAARADHLERRIRPALANGAWVLCDRFADSTRAYQGAGGAAPGELITALEQAVIGRDWPDLTVILDLPVAIGLARAADRGGAEQRFESKGVAFHDRLRAGFLEIAAAEPQRCCVIDANGGIDAVAESVWVAVRDRFGLKA